MNRSKRSVETTDIVGIETSNSGEAAGKAAASVSRIRINPAAFPPTGPSPIRVAGSFPSKRLRSKRGSSSSVWLVIGGSAPLQTQPRS
jgi:hypothetical protein